VDLQWFLLRIRIQLFLNADPNLDLDPGSQINEGPSDQDPNPDQTLNSQKVEFYMENIPEVSNRSKNIPTKVQRPF
jgi:hypothetical protein